MKRISVAAVCLGLLSLLVLTANIAGARRYDGPNPDPKGELYIVAFDSSQLSEKGAPLRKALEKHFSDTAEGTELRIFDTVAPELLAEEVLSLASPELARLGGVIALQVEKARGRSERATLEVYHYPFGAIAEEHIQSPEYSFKFGSDSALLAIRLYELLSAESPSGRPMFRTIEIAAAQQANPDLPRDVLRKSVRLALLSEDGLSRAEMEHVASLLAEAIVAFRLDEGYSVMGLLPEKVQRHARAKDVEIQVFKHLHADRELSDEEQRKREEEMASPLQVVRPFSSNLYYIAGLEWLSPYSLKFIDTSKDESDYWREVDEAFFVTSSRWGIVRTVPGRYEGYVPLESAFESAPRQASSTPEAEYVIEGATVFDGSRDRPRFNADVAVAGERIVAVGELKNLPRRTTIDGKGLFLTPGFIDIHSHADSNVLDVSYAPSHIRQGITSVLGGNCASSPLGIGAFLAEIDKKGAAVNIGMLLGNREARGRVMGRRKGQPTYDEVYRQKELVDLAMEEGAFGMSSGLIYTISEEAFTWELAELAKQLKPYGGFYASHVRGETDEVLDAIREAIYIGEIAEVPVQISHMKVINRRNWGDMKRYLEMMRAARARGLDLTGDQYPWRASGPAAHYTLYRLLVREAIKNETPEVVLLKDMPGKYAKYSGRNLAELLEGEKMTPEALIAELELTEESKIYATYLCLGDEDVCLPMKEDFVMVCTDASLASLDAIEKDRYRNDHPRKFRSYPEFFAKYVRDRGVCSWELGVYKCTGLPAQKMQLEDRGVIRPGGYADLVLLDPDELDPGVDYRDQAPPPKGIRWVFLNGEPVLKEGELSRRRAGKALYAYGHRKP